MADETPDLRPISKLQATRLSKLTGVDAAEITGSSVAELTDKLRWQIDLELLLFRRVCGRVVKRDPVTGALMPVPFATVHVEDTDCHVLWYSPADWGWGWFFPFFCHREEIATVVTDECGNFCVYVPRWEIDWILKWRSEWICPEIFVKPSIGDILEGLRPIPDPPPIREWPPNPRPGPIPDPPPISIRPGPLLHRAEELVGRTTARRLVNVELSGETTRLGSSALATRAEILESPKFRQPLPPPLSAEFAKLGGDEARKLLIEELRIEPELAKGLDLGKYLGPFWPCHQVIFPEWTPIFDVPDITFRVTQDVDGDGTEETIYSESYFDVRWNAGTIPDVVLEASEIAVAGVTCDGPEVPCEEPAIVMAGLMPLHNLPAPADAYHDSATGYASRPNRPHPSGLFGGPRIMPATAPFLGTLQLYGCNHVDGASVYRLRYSFEGGPAVPFTGLTWPLFRWVGSPGHLEVHWPTADADGWYPILADADGWMPGHLLLNWPTGQDGLYQVDLQIGDGASPPGVLNTTPAIGVRVDNSSPLAQLGLSWRQVGDPNWIPLGSFCPVVERPFGTDVEFKVDVTVSAAHLRSIQLWGGGCGGDRPVLTSGTPGGWEAILDGLTPVGLQHWHTGQFDNGASFPAIFRLAGGAPPGVYSFSLAAHSRAFNPAGGDGGFESDWFYDPVYRWSNPTFSLAVVNA